MDITVSLLEFLLVCTRFIQIVWRFNVVATRKTLYIQAVNIELDDSMKQQCPGIMDSPLSGVLSYGILMLK